MNLDGLFKASPPTPKADEASAKTEEGTWLTVFTDGGNAGLEQTKGSMSEGLDLNKSSKSDAQGDWLATFTGSFTKAPDPTNGPEKEETKRSQDDNDWFGTLTGTIGFGVPKVSEQEPNRQREGVPKVSDQETKTQQEDWFASFTGGLGLLGQKETSGVVNEAGDAPTRHNQGKDESPALDEGQFKTITNNVKSPVEDGVPNGRKSLRLVVDQDKMEDVELTDEHKETSSTKAQTDLTKVFEVVQPKEKVWCSDNLKDHGIEQNKNLHDEVVQVDSKQELNRPSLGNNHTDKKTVSSSLRNLIGLKENEDNKTNISENHDSVGNLPKQTSQTTCPQAGRKAMEKNSFATSIRNIMGLADEDSSSSNSNEKIKDSVDVPVKATDTVTKEKDIAPETTDGIMSLFDSFIGKGTEDPGPTTTESMKPPEDRATSIEASESNPKPENPPNGNSHGENTNSFGQATIDLQAHISEATVTIHSWVSFVQAFVSNQVAEINERVLVNPRHPKSHRRRVQTKRWTLPFQSRL